MNKKIATWEFVSVMGWLKDEAETTNRLFMSV